MMLSRTDTSITVEQDAAAPAAALFAVLTDPRRQVEMDGSGMLQAVAGGTDVTVIDHVDQVFSMAMHHPSLGDYVTDNRVVEFERDRRISWATSRHGQPPAGVRWGWQLTPLDDGRTRIVHTYDWSRVTDPAVLARVSFPRVSPDQLQDSVDRLVALAGAAR
jgi:uncharacterized protein YndB with AHSA1/START domain